MAELTGKTEKAIERLLGQDTNLGKSGMMTDSDEERVFGRLLVQPIAVTEPLRPR